MLIELNDDILLAKSNYKTCFCHDTLEVFNHHLFKKYIKNRECFLLLDPQTWTQNLALAYHALAEKVRSDYNKNKKQKTTPQTYIIPLCLQIKFFSKSYPKQTKYERLELFMNRCPPRPLKEIVLSNVHEKQGLKIKYFSAVLKNFWRLKVFSSELFFFCE